jgi:hypothetical protein
MLPPQQLKSMSELDKEEEVRLANTQVEKAKKVGLGFSRWVVRLTQRGNGIEKNGESK